MNYNLTYYVNDVPLDVSFNRSKYRPATYDDPAEGGEIDDVTVTIEGWDVTEIINGNIMDNIVTACQEYEEEGDYDDDR